MIKRRHRIWTEGEKLTVVLEADRDGAETVVKKYNIARTLLWRWRGPRPRLSESHRSTQDRPAQDRRGGRQVQTSGTARWGIPPVRTPRADRLGFRARHHVRVKAQRLL